MTTSPETDWMNHPLLRRNLSSYLHQIARAVEREDAVAVHHRVTALLASYFEQLREAMAGIEYRDTDAFIDEIPAAYKDIDQVMADAADLVEIRHTLRQIVNVKGD